MCRGAGICFSTFPDGGLRFIISKMGKGSPEYYEFDSNELLLRLDITLAATVEAINPVVDRIVELTREISCAAGKEFEIQASLQEALTNAVIHGCRKDASKSVQVTAVCAESKGMLIIVRDPGSGFDPRAIPSPVMGERIYATHGRGIFLINQLMDEVRFERGGAEIRMLKR
jgi:serine/threonine-protein kinase RsbW